VYRDKQICTCLESAKQASYWGARSSLKGGGLLPTVSTCARIVHGTQALLSCRHQQVRQHRMGPCPWAVRLQSPVLRTTTAGRSARSARLLVGSTPFTSKKVNKCFLCSLSLLASRALSKSATSGSDLAIQHFPSYSHINSYYQVLPLRIYHPPFAFFHHIQPFVLL